LSSSPTGPVTLMDVAREAGVSLATASRAFNGSTRRVREDLRQRVFAAAEKLDYSANSAAQAMARGRTNVVGLLVRDIADPYFSSIAAGVMRAADGRGLLVTLASTLNDPAREVEHLASLRGQRCRSAILVGSRVQGRALEERLEQEITAFEGTGGRVVTISQPRLPVDTVVPENRAGARSLALELVALGYRRFAVLAGPTRLLASKDRVQGFRDGLAVAGVTAPVVVSGEFSRDGGYDSMNELLDRGNGIDCVFAVNDVMAVGAMAACRQRGLELPRDLALAGFDDIVTLRDVNPALSTVRLPLEDMGRLALDLVESERQQTPRVVKVKGEVLLRASTPRKVAS
jgi:LacI family transcriptional regulator